MSSTSGKAFLRLIKQRHSTYIFSNKKVKQSDIKTIIEAGRLAPSSHNSQCWEFIVIEKKKTIGALMDTCHYGSFHSNPSALIAMVLGPLFVDKEEMLIEKIEEFVKSHRYLNLGFPAMQMLLQAEALGIDSCLLSPVIKNANFILQVPDNFETILMIGLGYQKKGTKHKHSKRKPLSKIVSYEKFSYL